MAEAHTQAVAGSRWSGGVAPYAIASKKLGMWLFIISDALTFSVLILAYSYVRIASPDWPTPFPFFPAIVYATVMTFFLLSSSLTMVMAVAVWGIVISGCTMKPSEVTSRPVPSFFRAPARV